MIVVEKAWRLSGKPGAPSGSWLVKLPSTHRKHREKRGAGQGYKPTKAAPNDLLPPARLPTKGELFLQPAPPTRKQVFKYRLLQGGFLMQ